MHLHFIGFAKPPSTKWYRQRKAAKECFSHDGKTISWKRLAGRQTGRPVPGPDVRPRTSDKDEQASPTDHFLPARHPVHR